MKSIAHRQKCKVPCSKPCKSVKLPLENETFAMPDPFLVLATQNPIEQEGTYPLPEAQVDRFMLKVRVTYPNKQEERTIVDRMSRDAPPQIETVTTTDDLIRARSVADEIYVDDKIKDYIVDLVLATRDPEAYGLGDLRALIEFGGSPRASIALTPRCQSACVFAPPRLCHSRRCESHWPGRIAPPRTGDIRGRSRRN